MLYLRHNPSHWPLYPDFEKKAKNKNKCHLFRGLGTGGPGRGALCHEALNNSEPRIFEVTQLKLNNLIRVTTTHPIEFALGHICI